MNRQRILTQVTLLLLAALLLLMSGSTLAAPAEDEYVLSLWTELGGGSPWMSSADSVFMVGATAGQSGVGEEPMIGGEYSLTGGYWSPLEEAQIYLPVVRK